jgi:hypothetical protein
MAFTRILSFRFSAYCDNQLTTEAVWARFNSLLRQTVSTFTYHA